MRTRQQSDPVPSGAAPPEVGERAELDVLMANAWQPELSLTEGTWRLRFSHGVTRRANSALALGGADRLEELVGAAERFYEERGAPVVVQVSSVGSPRRLEEVLLARGYERSARTLVMTADTRDVSARTEAWPWGARSSAEPDDAWFQVYWGVKSPAGAPGPEAAICRQFLLRPARPTVFASVGDSERAVVGVGQIVLEAGWAGVQCMATAVGQRRRGAAGGVLHQLAADAGRGGASRMYLAVLADNGEAIRLYEAAGFAVVQEYCYFTA